MESGHDDGRGEIETWASLKFIPKIVINRRKLGAKRISGRGTIMRMQMSATEINFSFFYSKLFNIFAMICGRLQRIKSSVLRFYESKALRG